MMITLMILLTGIWMLALTWALLEVYSIAEQWLHDRVHTQGRSVDVD